MWAATGEGLAVPAAILTGVFIDSDHLIDNFDGRERGIKIHMWRPFHAWEYVAVGLVILALGLTHPLYIAALLGYTSHLVLDNLFNETHPMAYLISFRIKHRFRRARLTPKMFERQLRYGNGRAPFWAKAEPTVWRIVQRRRRKQRERNCAKVVHDSRQP